MYEQPADQIWIGVVGWLVGGLFVQRRCIESSFNVLFFIIADIYDIRIRISQHQIISGIWRPIAWKTGFCIFNTMAGVDHTTSELLFTKYTPSYWYGDSPNKRETVVRPYS